MHAVKAAPPSALRTGGAVLATLLMAGLALLGPASVSAATTHLTRASPAGRNQESASATQAAGIDVSDIQHENGSIIWATVAGNFQFAYVKATESNDYTNPFFGTDLTSALADGMYAGGYAFGRPDAVSGTTEAAYFLQVTGYALGKRVLAPMIDMETDPYNSSTPCYGLTQSAMVSWIEAFSNAIHDALGRYPVLYTDAGFWDQCTGGSSALADDPLWVASYDTSTPTLPEGFPTWVLWQTGVGTAAGVTGPVDLDVADGGTAVLASQLTDDGGAVPLTEADASPAVVYDPLNHNVEIYVRGLGGSLFERYWSPSSSWSAWIDLGGSITNSPTAIYDPTTRHVDVFARSDGGALDLWSWSPSTSWVFTGLGGDIIGAPNALSNPANGNLQVYAEGAAGDLQQDYEAGGKWAGWASLGGAIVSTPAAVYDAKLKHFEVYAEGTQSQLEETWWSSATGWSGWLNLSGGIVGQPSAMADPLNGNIELYVTGVGDSLWENYFSSGTGWSGWLTLGGGLIGSPTAIYNPQQKHIEIYVQGTTHAGYEKWWGRTTGWSSWIFLGGSLATRPSVVSDPDNGNLEVYDVSPSGNSLEERYFTGRAWSPWVDLGGGIG